MLEHPTHYHLHAGRSCWPEEFHLTMHGDATGAKECAKVRCTFITHALYVEGTLQN